MAMVDFTKLAKAPWKRCTANNGKCPCCLIWSIPDDVPVAWADDQENNLEAAIAHADAIIMMRNAADIQMRLGWSAHSEWSKSDGVVTVNGWHVVDHNGWRIKGDLVTYPDPCMALVATEEWYLKNGGK